MQLLASDTGARLGDSNLSLRTKVSHEAFRLSWGWHEKWPDEIPEEVVAELADDADRCNDLRELNCENTQYKV